MNPCSCRNVPTQCHKAENNTLKCCVTIVMFPNLDLEIVV
jgi:hypothetical protein